MACSSCSVKFSARIQELPGSAMFEVETQNEALKDLAEHVCESLEDQITGFEVAHGELCLHAHAEHIIDVLHFLRDNPECRFSQLMDICGADYPDRPEARFDVVYQLLSISMNQRIRVKIRAGEATIVPSATEVFRSAGWFERETWDMYGIYFDGHPDLRRILTDYGFDGHPMRKDFPLTGYVELRYDEELRRVVYEPVKLTQDFRSFDFLSPWEGMTDIHLPGDEKAAAPEHGWRPYDKGAKNSG